jgi:hypothetical protein
MWHISCEQVQSSEAEPLPNPSQEQCKPMSIECWHLPKKQSRFIADRAATGPTERRLATSYATLNQTAGNHDGEINRSPCSNRQS